MMSLQKKQFLIASVNWLLVLLAVWLLWKLFVTLVLPEPILNTQRSIESSSRITSGRWGWFGASQISTQSDDLERARLNGKVLGVILKGDLSVALISLPGRPEGVYKVGDDITSETSLEAVESDRIVIRESGVLREIPLQRLDGKKASTANLVTHNGQKSSAGSINRSGGNSSDGSMELLGMARAIPVIVDGANGLRLDDLSLEIQDLSELKSGDVLMSVEGQDIVSLQANNNWQSLINKTDAKVTVVRDGQPLEIQVNVATLAQQALQLMQTK